MNFLSSTYMVFFK